MLTTGQRKQQMKHVTIPLSDGNRQPNEKTGPSVGIEYKDEDFKISSEKLAKEWCKNLPDIE